MAAPKKQAGQKYRLKPTAPEITATCGPLAGHTFRHGRLYDAVPAGDAARFDRVETVAPAAPKSQPKSQPDSQPDSQPETPSEET